MGIFAFFEKLEKLNPKVDFSPIIERINIMRGELPVNFHHGSYFDLTNIAILRDIVDERSCPPWLRKREIQSFAARALTGVFFHTDVGHAVHGLQEMSQKEQPQRIRFCSDASLSDFDKGYANSPFYVFQECLHNQNIWREGAAVSVQPIRIFDGNEHYMTADNIDPVGYFSDGYGKKLITSQESRAYLITLDFMNTIRHCSPDCFENRYLRQMRENRHTEDVFNPVYVILFNLSTHYLSRHLKEEGVDIFSLYEANDADSSGTLRDSMPEPLCNANYIISGRGCMFESGHAENYSYDYPHKIMDAYFRFNNYGFLGMAGILQPEDEEEAQRKYGQRRSVSYQYYHGLHSTRYIYGLPSVRLIFKRQETPINPLENPEIKKRYDRLVYLQTQLKQLELKINSLDSQVPWLFLTEPPRVHILRLIKNEKHRTQIDMELLRIQKQLLVRSAFNMLPSDRMKCANAMNRYMTLLKKRNRPLWMIDYVSCVRNMNRFEDEIKRLSEFLEPLLNRLESAN